MPTRQLIVTELGVEDSGGFKEAMRHLVFTLCT